MKKIISKISVFVLMFCSVMILSACSLFQKDGVNITGIDIIDETVPNYILAKEGEFDKAGIKIKVSYSDESYKDITVTTSMIPAEYQDELLTPGEYDITILFKGHETVLHIKVAEVANVYTVKFFNGYNNLISVQEVKEGEDAVAPNASHSAIAGFEFMGWDRDITNVTEDMDVYATYIKVENTLTEEVLEEKFYNAINYTMTTSHISTSQEIGDGWGELYLTNFHYDKETREIEFQTKSYCDGELMMYIEVKNGYASGLDYEDGYHMMYSLLAQEECYMVAGINTEETIAESFEMADSVEYSYLIAGNKTTYYCTFIYSYGLKVVYEYDDSAILSCKSHYKNQYNDDMELFSQIDYVYSAEEVPFEDWSSIFTEDVEEKVNQGKLDLIEAYNNTITADMIVTFMKLDQTNYIKYDKDNKVSAEYTYQNELVNVKWEDATETNSYDGTNYTTTDGILSFIPNFAEIIETGKYNSKDITIYVSYYYEGEDLIYSIDIETDEHEIIIEIENDKIMALECDGQYSMNRYSFEYENVELNLPEDIKNKVENAELTVNN